MILERKEETVLENEEQLLEEIKQDSTRFGVLFDNYYSPIFNYTLRRVANPYHTRDIVSDVFFKAMNSIDSFEWRGVSILNWLYRIANNEIARFFRSPHQKFASLDYLKDLNVQFASNSNLEKEMEEAELALEKHQAFLEIQKLLKTLPIDYQEVISLRYFENRKLSEIALIIDKNENTTKALLYRGVEKLKKLQKSATNQ